MYLEKFLRLRIEDSTGINADTPLCPVCKGNLRPIICIDAKDGNDKHVGYFWQLYCPECQTRYEIETERDKYHKTTFTKEEEYLKFLMEYVHSMAMELDSLKDEVGSLTSRLQILEQGHRISNGKGSEQEDSSSRRQELERYNFLLG